MACILFLILALRVTYIVIFNKESKRIYNDPEVAKDVVRGEIVDSKNNLLAIQTLQYALYINIDNVEDVKTLAQTISPYVFISEEEIEKKIKNSTKRNVTIDKIPKEYATSLEKLIKEKNLSAQISMVSYNGRSYPAGYHAAHLIGDVDIDNHGKYGIEKDYDALLLPYPELDKETTYGNNLVLSIELPVQYLLDSQLKKLSQVNNIDKLSGIIMDVSDGSVLAISKYPFIDRSETIKIDEDKSYKVGAIAELLSSALAIEKGYENEIGQLENVATINNEEIYNFYKELFAFSPSFDLPDFNSWSEQDRKAVLTGQLFDLDIYSIASAVVSLADGEVKKPIIVKKIDSKIERKIQGKSVETRTVFSSETASQIRNYLKIIADQDPYFKKIEDIDIAAISLFDESSSTIALVPADEPKFLIYITKSNEEGSTPNGDTAYIASQVIKGLIGQGKLTSNNQKRLEIY
ncbi:MAG: hypothetical protein K6G51_07825 [Sphaerochaetaceae bacterium]|nr:hypothetical protein [Sphaerochaetaceae bacterium]